jgi:predicted nucleic acid-binding protein
MSFLIDTVVLSELRKKDRDENVVRWFKGISVIDLFLSVVTIGEVEKGIAGQKKKNPAFAKKLEDWLTTVLLHYSDRILPIDTSIARRWGRLSEELGHSGVDLLIAATALEHGLTVVTRNTRHFELTGASILDPWLKKLNLEA